MDVLFPGMAALKNNIHPLLVHFPIAFFLGALLMEGLAVLRDEKFHFPATCMLYLGTLSAMITLPTGLIAANLVAATDPRGHDAPGLDGGLYPDGGLSLRLYFLDQSKKKMDLSSLGTSGRIDSFVGGGCIGSRPRRPAGL